ncbi:MAG TPA: SDR family NAD(P)-dependent oxidoreductase [Solirubrobacteraceae bacterium]|jgi:NAD(P)-dependent dehydrogenase (short-subunit alcohol dehydrogenase family)
MKTERIALVTGANRGLGFALVKGLAARLDDRDLVLLTGRNAERVAGATEAVGGMQATRSRVEGRVLDVGDAGAIAGLATELAERYGGVDIVVSNASAPLTRDRPQAEQAQEFIAVANHGTHAMLRSFGPLLNPGGRLIVVASSLGTLGHLQPQLRPLFDGVSLDQVQAAVESWLAAIGDGTAQELSWPRWLNVPSKVAQVAAVRAVAAERRAGDLARGTLIAAVCPGLVDTPLSRPWFEDFSRAQSPDRAARAIVELIFSDRVDPAMYGELVRFGEVLDWRSGTPPRYQDQLLAA